MRHGQRSNSGENFHTALEQQHERKYMNNKFDELTKSMAQSVTRRGALKKFGVALAGMALACLGLTSKAAANPKPTEPCLPLGYACKRHSDCCSGNCAKPTKQGWIRVSTCGL
jgi:hypothetical protein